MTRRTALEWVAAIVMAGGGLWWTECQKAATGRAAYAMGQADAAAYATWVADSTWAFHLGHTQPHFVQLPDGQGDTVQVVFSYAACPDPIRAEIIKGGLP